MTGISPQLLLSFLAGGMLLLAFFIVARMRLRSMLMMFAWQSFLLACYAALVAMTTNESHLLITAVLTVVLKTWAIPFYLQRSAERSGASQRLQSFLRPASALLIGSVMVIGAFFLTQRLVPMTDPNYITASVSVSMMLLGLLALVTRKGMYGQIIGFLLMENGIFTFGLTLTGGMPLLVELGVFFDVTIGSVLMAALSYRVQKEHDTVVTDRLSELVD